MRRRIFLIFAIFSITNIYPLYLSFGDYKTYQESKYTNSNWDTLVKAGYNEANKSNYSIALNYFNTAIEKGCKEYVDIYKDTFICYIRLGKLNEGIDWLKKNASNLDSNLFIGLYYLDGKLYDKALEHLEKSGYSENAVAMIKEDLKSLMGVDFFISRLNYYKDQRINDIFISRFYELFDEIIADSGDLKYLVLKNISDFYKNDKKLYNLVVEIFVKMINRYDFNGLMKLYNDYISKETNAFALSNEEIKKEINNAILYNIKNVQEYDKLSKFFNESENFFTFYRGEYIQKNINDFSVEIYLKGEELLRNIPQEQLFEIIYSLPSEDIKLFSKAQETSKTQPYKEYQLKRIIKDYFRAESDNITGDVTFYSNSSPTTRKTNSFHLSIKTTNDSIKLFLNIQYFADDWLFINDYKIRADDQLFTIVPKKVFRDNETDIWEFSKIEMGEKEIEAIKYIAGSNKAMLRYSGTDFFSDREITDDEKKDLQLVLSLYAAIKATYQR